MTQESYNELMELVFKSENLRLRDIVKYDFTSINKTQQKGSAMVVSMYDCAAGHAMLELDNGIKIPRSYCRKQFNKEEITEDFAYIYENKFGKEVHHIYRISDDRTYIDTYKLDTIEEYTETHIGAGVADIPSIIKYLNEGTIIF